MFEKMTGAVENAADDASTAANTPLKVKQLAQMQVATGRSDRRRHREEGGREAGVRRREEERILRMIPLSNFYDSPHSI